MDGASSADVVIAGTPDVDEDELHELGANLRRRLLDLDVADVRPARAGEAPGGAKSGEAVAAGALVVTLAPVALRSVLRFVETWMRNRPVRKVTVTVDGRSIELGHASRADQERLIDAFVGALPTGAGEDSDDAG